MPPPVLSPRARISADKADRLLKCYAARLPPKEVAVRVGLTLNTVYEQYHRIRWRLILVGYYRDGALSIDEPGLSPEAQRQLKRRRGIGQDDFYAHAAEVIEWAEEWPPGEVLRILRKIIALTCPLDVEPDLSPEYQSLLKAYIRYARTKLIHNRAKTEAETDETNVPFLERAEAALNAQWKAYRNELKRVERSKPRKTRGGGRSHT
jgi:hypothetical protein